MSKHLVTVPPDRMVHVSLFTSARRIEEFDDDILLSGLSFGYISLYLPPLSPTSGRRYLPEYNWFLYTFPRTMTKEECNAYNYIIGLNSKNQEFIAIFTNKVANLLNKVNLKDDDKNRLIVYVGGEQK